MKPYCQRPVIFNGKLLLWQTSYMGIIKFITNFKEMKKLSTWIILILFIIVSACSQSPKAKYVFLFIGDGMGMSQVYATQMYLQADQDTNNDLLMPNFPYNSTMTTYSANTFITCSSAAATAMSTGYKTNNGVLGKSADLSVNYETFSVKAKNNGFKVGILSNVNIDHATPAGFYAHQDSRNMYYEISMELPNYNIDYFGGGGFHYPKGKEENQPDAYENAIEKGYKIINTKKDFNRLGKTDSKIFAINPDIYSQGDMYWEIDREENSLSLADFTKKGIEVIDNSKGFFMMVEGGKIDWAGHANDAASLIHEVIGFDDAIKVAYEFYKAKPNETLIVVTADHETGSMFNGINYSIKPELLAHQKISKQEFSRIIETTIAENPKVSFEETLALIENYFGLGNEDKGLALSDNEKEFLQNAYKNEITNKITIDPDADYLKKNTVYTIAEASIHILNTKAGIGWGSHDHSGTPVPVFVIGKGQEEFTKQFDNTELSKKIGSIMGFSK